MKRYDTNFIKSYIEKHREEIETVTCGMREDWGWTNETVYENGKLCGGHDWNGKHISVAGINGSSWATPAMKVEFKDSRTEVVHCYVDDGKQASPSQIAEQMAFAAATGGMDCI